MTSTNTEGQRIYAIGDVHGRDDLLSGAIERIRKDLAARPHPQPHIVLLGDYVDRGPNSRGVIEQLIALRDGDIATSFLLGNHDNYILAYLEDPEWFDRSIHWLNPRLGGDQTLASYGVLDANEYDPLATHAAFKEVLPESHLDFIQNCLLFERIGSYLFVHAGIRPGVPLERQFREDLIWIREPFLSSTRDFGFKVVHGHTIVKSPEHLSNRIAIDTGAYTSENLTCLVLEDANVSLLTFAGLISFPMRSRTIAGGIAHTIKEMLKGG
ncbi:metallophosphoesterase [Amaricoccus macauensis]|uniref:metallophosphoesterase n=1 Tax=Amaricoccus macauensis TaxID=57001 RepID=UPI003C7E2D22